MGTINWGELFPGRWSPVIFISYMALFVNQGIIVTWSQRDGHYEYNIVMVVLMTEVLKLFASITLYCKDNRFMNLCQEVTENKKELSCWYDGHIVRDKINYKATGNLIALYSELIKYRSRTILISVLLLYMIPSFLYCLYNNLAFINLAAFDPTTYYVLLQFRVVMTGIIFQVVFNKKLSLKQWFSLVLLTIGCMVKHMDMDLSVNIFNAKINLNINIILVFVQTICSCLAGVYNEYLLKEQGANINIFVQNVFMYIDSIFCNLIVFILFFMSENRGSDMLNNADLSIFMQPKVILIMLNNTAIGIITSFFLKNLNSILKTFASALELIFTAVLCWLIFSIPIHLNTVISITMVSYAVVLYSQNPVQNTLTKERTKVDSIV